MVGGFVAGCSSDDLPVLTPDGSLPAGEPHQLEVGTHCGVGRFGLLVNERSWISDEAAGARDWMPTEWSDTLDRGEELLTVEVRLSEDGDTLTATVAGRSVTYRPVTSDDPLFECA